MKKVFDSRDKYYRNPCGAVEQGTNIHFKIKLPRNIGCSAAYLVMRDDNSNNDTVLSLFWCGMPEEGYEEWECDFSTEQVGLYWYRFDIDTYDGRKSILKVGNSGEGTLDYGSMWQLTVYERNFKTPDWLLGGTIYQIFPDRFYNSGTKKKNIPEDRYIHESWDEQPAWKLSGGKNILNFDYYGGDLKGIEKKLDYLKDLGITCIYLNPIFEAHANHRYNTADYSKIDPLLGDENDFKRLCSKAKKCGIKIILDGVFSHTGSDSIYFNKYNRYDSLGAYNSKESEYYSWYHFIDWPSSYHSWWGFDTLPELEKTDSKYNEFINGDKGIIKKWLKLGASGWRLDVADELPDSFIDNIREAVKSENKDAILIGEVWEDASNKEAYGQRRRYLLGKQLDSVMNYPFKNAIFDFLKGANGFDVINSILSIIENYPPQVINVLMNNIGTHDTERAVTMLAGEPDYGRGREWQCQVKLNEEQKLKGLKLMKMASLMQYTLPGVPCLYYADEVFTEGYKDPFNRSTYPWGKENKELLNWYKALGKMRRNCLSLKEGKIEPFYIDKNFISYKRGDDVLCLFNSSCNESKQIKLPDTFKNYEVIIGNKVQSDVLIIEPLSCLAIKKI